MLQALLGLIVEGSYSSEDIKDLLRPATETLSRLSSLQTLPLTLSEPSYTVISPGTNTVKLRTLAGTYLVFFWVGGDDGDLYVTVEGTTQVCFRCHLLPTCSGSFHSCYNLAHRRTQHGIISFMSS